jgi:hypothetical protein
MSHLEEDINGFVAMPPQSGVRWFGRSPRAAVAGGAAGSGDCWTRSRVISTYRFWDNGAIGGHLLFVWCRGDKKGFRDGPT